MLLGSASSISRATATDDDGTIGVRVEPQHAGVAMTLARAPKGALHLGYDVRANESSPDDPTGELVLDDRFRGAGETLVFWPDALADVSAPVEIRIDGSVLRAPNAASSFGVGATKRVKARGRALAHAGFVAGSLGGAQFDAIEGHDEAAWLGYTAFDPRPSVAELAETRTAMAETFKEQDIPGPPMTYLFVSQARPAGWFSVSPRAQGVAIEMGPSEPWGAALRMAIAQELAHGWIGGELWIGPTDAAHDAEGWWFSEGVARFYATRVLSRLGLLAPGDVRDVIGGELSVDATSGLRGVGNAEIAAHAKTDGVARAELVARGALYAARENAVIRARSKNAKSLDAVVLALLEEARAARKPLPTSAWIDALAKEDPDAAATFDAIVVKGGAIDLPSGALGPCFRAGKGEYVAFDLGFDADATLEAKDKIVAGLRADGPAAKAGVLKGDAIVEAEYKDGQPDVLVKLKLKRAGKDVALTYAPRGAKGKGQTWTRVAGKRDETCGDPI
jgi:hypothetical protein